MPFIGRQAEFDEALDLLEDPSVRLLTVLGIGGIGKTAFALELARGLQERYEHGAAFVPLAHLASLDELLPALADVLDVQLPPNGDLQQAVLDHLAGLQLLLLFDSFEHFLEEAVLIQDILVAAPRVKILVTSREKLNLEVETLFTLGGLSVPPIADSSGGPVEQLQAIQEYDSVRLFVQRAGQVRPAFSFNGGNASDVVRICRMVDGNPLGILLAASWVEHFSPAEIAEEAGNSLAFLTRSLRGADARHSSLRVVFESSFRRLEEERQDVFQRLSVFRGGFDLASAAAVAGADLSTLIELVEKSMLSRDPESGRYELPGLLSQYASEQLTLAGERDSVRRRHTAYYTVFVQEREPRLKSALQAVALDEFQSDFDNIRHAWSRVVEERDHESARLMIPGLYAFCDMRSRFYEGEALFRLGAEGLAPVAGAPPNPVWALALLSWFDMRNYIEHFETYEDIASQGGDCLEQATSNADVQAAAASLVLLGTIADHQGDFRTALQRYEAAARAYPPLDDVYWVNMRIGLAYQSAREYARAIDAFQLSLDRGTEIGEQVKIGWSLQNIGDTLLLQGNAAGYLAEAEGRLQQALACFQQVGTRIGVLSSTYSLGRAAMNAGKLARARELAQAAAQLARQLHSPSWIQKTDDLLRQLELDASSAGSARGCPQDDPLSQREFEILQWLKTEMSGPEIARRLVVSLNTVRFHTKHIYQKLGVNSRLEAIRRARELGL